jgi:hypothetical protein
MKPLSFLLGILSSGLCVCMPDISAQEVRVVRDSIRAARIVADRLPSRDAGTRVLPLSGIRTMVAATGEADAIKFIQALPGVSTGAEGSSAIYVRGGNIGSNVTTLDGVPLYGSSHLLGLASAYPSAIISSASFRNGGFRGADNNLTASHIAIQTGNGSFTNRNWNLSVSNFLLGGYLSTPLVKNKISLIASLRVSPIGPEFNAVKGLLGGALDSLSRVRAFAYDAFAKATWQLNKNNTLTFSVFNSADAYRYIYGGDSDESMMWNNLILNAREELLLDRDWRLDARLSYNHFSSSQGIIRDMAGTINNLAIVSSLDELSARADFIQTFGEGKELRLGAVSRAALFNPGTSSTFVGTGAWMMLDSPRTDNRSWSLTQTLYAQMSLERTGHYELMACAKLNANEANTDGDGRFRLHINPEGSLLSRINLTRWLAVEATVDWAVQYYHTLEGIPLGWSLDMMVPTDSKRGPEQALQCYGAILSGFGQHRITIGAYWKKMYNLVWFVDAGQLFSSAISGWKDNIAVGTGSSRGVEFLYEKEGEHLNYKVAYTWSKTDRSFPRIHEGTPFPAKFDRRHILNVQASWVIVSDNRRDIGVTGFFTYQSGHWETVPDGEYLALFPLGGLFTLDYYSGGVNNYEMPPYMRLDLGCYFKFKGRYPQELNIGVYNVLNRHNPFSITYDDRSGQWRQISLFPIMPSISYSIEF